MNLKPHRNLKRWLAALLLPSCVAPAYAAPTTFVHLFEWSWPDIASECEQFLGPAGYAAVQVSPPNEHIQGGQWWTRYQPVSYQLQSRSGDRAAFAEMVSRCRAAGVAIYVDAVVNHMAAGSGSGTAGSSFGNRNYPNYASWDFHNSCSINGSDYGNDPWRVQNCELVGLPDLNTSSSYVQTTIANYLNELTQLGVAGFRIDAAKHIASADIAALRARLQGNPLIFQEVIDQGGEAVRASDYVSHGLVTEFKYSSKLSEVFKSGQLAWLASFGESWGMLPSTQAVVFVDNHDNQRGHGGAGNVLTHKDGRLYELANVFMLAWPYGYPKVMSSYQFTDSDAGPPSSAVHQGSQLNCQNGSWQCEHRWGYIQGAMQFRNQVNAGWQVSHWWDNGGNQIAFSRASADTSADNSAALGFVAINRDGVSMNALLSTGLAAGQYCDLLTGGLQQQRCVGQTLTVNNQGQVQLQLPAMSAVAITGASKLPEQRTSDWQRTQVLIKAQTQAGQDMFIRGGLDHQAAKARLGRDCTDTNYRCAMPIRHLNMRNSTTAPWKLADSYLDWYGAQSGQATDASGSALDWTTDVWPTSWGAVRWYEQDGFGQTPINSYGAHYWLFDVEMDCSQTDQGWFELKAYVRNGQGWENDIQQPNTPYFSRNHFARCGMKNVFEFNQAAASIVPVTL